MDEKLTENVSAPVDGGKARKVKSKDSHKVMVVGIPVSMTNARLEVFFQKYGSVKGAAVVTDTETGKSKGFGFVEFTEEEPVEKAIKQLDNSKLGSRTLHVRRVEEKDTSKPSDRGANSNKNKTKRPCFSFVKKGRCVKGDSCRYSHMVSQTRKKPSSETPRASLLDSTPSESETTTLTKVPEGYCFMFQRGSCHRGRACRFKHEKPESDELVQVQVQRESLKSDESRETDSKAKVLNDLTPAPLRDSALLAKAKAEQVVKIKQVDYSSESSEEESEDDGSSARNSGGTTKTTNVVRGKKRLRDARATSTTSSQWYAMDGTKIKVAEDDDGLEVVEKVSKRE